MNSADSNGLAITNAVGCEGYVWWAARYVGKPNDPVPAVNMEIAGVLGQALGRTATGVGATMPCATLLAAITDGLSNTLLVGEVTSVGFDFGTPAQSGSGLPFQPGRVFARTAFESIATRTYSGVNPNRNPSSVDSSNKTGRLQSMNNS